MSERMCSIESCERPYIAKGLCSSHYARKRKYGDPNAQRRRDRDMSIPEILTHYSQPDGECVAWGGPKSSSGYGCFRKYRDREGIK